MRSEVSESCDCGKPRQFKRKTCGSSLCLHRLLHNEKRKAGEVPCPLCVECEECHLFTHKYKPLSHHGSCSRFGRG